MEGGAPNARLADLPPKKHSVPSDLTVRFDLLQLIDASVALQIITKTPMTMGALDQEHVRSVTLPLNLLELL